LGAPYSLYLSGDDVGVREPWPRHPVIVVIEKVEDVQRNVAISDWRWAHLVCWTNELSKLEDGVQAIFRTRLLATELDCGRIEEERDRCAKIYCQTLAERNDIIPRENLFNWWRGFGSGEFWLGAFVAGSGLIVWRKAGNQCGDAVFRLRAFPDQIDLPLLDETSMIAVEGAEWDGFTTIVPLMRLRDRRVMESINGYLMSLQADYGIDEEPEREGGIKR
jgi:hypothetical protein